MPSRIEPRISVRSNKQGAVILRIVYDVLVSPMPSTCISVLCTVRNFLFFSARDSRYRNYNIIASSSGLPVKLSLPKSFLSDSGIELPKQTSLVLTSQRSIMRLPSSEEYGFYHVVVERYDTCERSEDRGDHRKLIP